jgi:Domain of unknown function (DUF4440)
MATGRTVSMCLSVAVVGVVVLAQEGKWAKDDDARATHMIALEREWAEEACTHKIVVDTLLADDFEGTAPDGSRYGKEQEVQEARSSKKKVSGCQLDEARVRFFGDAIAIVYGKDRAVVPTEAGVEETRCLVWTDTWLKRGGRWQIVAAQDARTKCQ